MSTYSLAKGMFDLSKARVLEKAEDEKYRVLQAYATALNDASEIAAEGGFWVDIGEKASSDYASRLIALFEVDGFVVDTSEGWIIIAWGHFDPAFDLKKELELSPAYEGVNS